MARGSCLVPTILRSLAGKLAITLTPARGRGIIDKRQEPCAIRFYLEQWTNGGPSESVKDSETADVWQSQF